MFEKKIDIDNTTIRYLEGGPESDSSPPILFLHGWALSPETFQAGLKILSHNHRVIAPDLPGFNKSNFYTSSWQYSDYAEVILSFVKALDIKKLHIVGHSMGGGISILLAATNPSLIESLILVDSAGIPLGSLSMLILHRLIELPAQAWATRFTPLNIKIFSASSYNFLFRTRNTISALNPPLKEDIRQWLPHIRSCCLIIWGEKDRTIPISFGRELVHNIKRVRMVTVENAYHEWSSLLPEKFASIISKFINQIEKRERPDVIRHKS